jgi:glycine dehydrogenase subunit 1
MICELTGMDVANSSLYDWASALGEAARMTQRLTSREEILIPEIIHPERLATLQSYIQPTNMQIRSVGFNEATGQMNIEELGEKISKKTASVYVENPSYLGFTEANVEEIGKIAHEHGAFFVVGVDPISLGVFEAPGEYGADIVIGEGQPLGNPMNFGGPLLGIFACRGESVNIRQMPGRIVGMTTVQNEAQRAYCMVLQTREQHIRRHKATSNICSNETLCALSAAVYLALLGPSGLKELGNTIIAKTRYAMKHLSEIDGVECPIFNSFHFKEFTVKFNQKTVENVHRDLLRHKIIGGKDVSEEFPKLGEIALYCVTETHSKETIDRLIKSIDRTLEGC